MKLPLSWIREMVDVDLTPPGLAHALTMAGTEVESLHRVGAEWRRVVIARVEEIERVKGTDNLFVTQVDAGSGLHTVVTGAPNLSAGDRVPWVQPGGALPGGFEISERKFRGIRSEGMLCAADELGLGSDHDGIYILEPDAPLGVELVEFLDDWIFDFKITPNRPDTMNVLGIAREIGALRRVPIRPSQVAQLGGEHSASDLVGVSIADRDLCARYTAAVVLGVTVWPSPTWLQRRLYLSGTRPISNVVDVTNYVMLELGQPLHAFDRKRIHGTIVTRRSLPGEKLTTLDGQARELPPDTLVIADDSGAIAVAGVMGGLASEVTDSTTEVVIEAANFDRISIRHASKALRLSTEASKRFERGIDPDQTDVAARRAALMIAELGGGTTAAGVVDEYPGRRPHRIVVTNAGRVARLLGKSYPADQIEYVLESLGFEVTLDGAHIRATVPGWRQDVEGPADIAEEVARITGYEEIPNTLPAGRVPEPYPDDVRRWGAMAKRTLVSAGLQEVLTYSLVDPRPVEMLVASSGAADERPVQPIAIANPLSSDHAALRTTLVPSLLATVQSNLRHSERVWIFELARVYLPPLSPLPEEVRRLAVALTGPRLPGSWNGTAEASDFFDLKGILQALLDSLGLRHARWIPTEHPSLHPGQSAAIEVGGLILGYAGQLHPTVGDRFELDERAIFIAELDFEAMARLASNAPPIVAPPRYPGVEMDIALVVSEDVPHEAVEAALREAGAPLLEHSSLFDIYRGQPIAEGSKSLAYSLTYRAPDRTLTEQDASEVHERIESLLRARFGAQIRGR